MPARRQGGMPRRTAGRGRSVLRALAAEVSKSLSQSTSPGSTGLEDGLGFFSALSVSLGFSAVLAGRAVTDSPISKAVMNRQRVRMRASFRIGNSVPRCVWTSARPGGSRKDQRL